MNNKHVHPPPPQQVAEHACSKLNNTFDTVMQFMANTTYQCKVICNCRK